MKPTTNYWSDWDAAHDRQAGRRARKKSENELFFTARQSKTLEQTLLVQHTARHMKEVRIEATHRLPLRALKKIEFSTFLIRCVSFYLIFRKRLKNSFLLCWCEHYFDLLMSKERREKSYELRATHAYKRRWEARKMFFVVEEKFSLFSKLVANKARLLLVTNPQFCSQFHRQRNFCCNWKEIHQIRSL